MPDSLATRRSLSTAPITASAVVTTQNIIAGGGVFEVDLGAAQTVDLYVGFPVIVQLDDAEIASPKVVTKVGAGTEAYNTVCSAGHYRIRRPVRRLRFLAPGNYSTQAQMLGRHGSVIIIGSNPEIEPLPINPDLLPCHTADMVVTIALGTTSSLVTIADTAFDIGNATPTDIWIKYVSIARQIAATGAPTGTLYDFIMQKANLPAGDFEVLFGINFMSAVAWSPIFTVPNLHICIKACSDAYGANAGAIQFATLHDTNAVATALKVRIGYAYLL